MMSWPRMSVCCPEPGLYYNILLLFFSLTHTSLPTCASSSSLLSLTHSLFSNLLHLCIVFPLRGMCLLTPPTTDATLAGFTFLTFSSHARWLVLVLSVDLTSYPRCCPVQFFHLTSFFSSFYSPSLSAAVYCVVGGGQGTLCSATVEIVILTFSVLFIGFLVSFFICLFVASHHHVGVCAL